MKIKEFPIKNWKIKKKVEKEYRAFEKSMFSKTKQEIYDSCNMIHFYSCIYEYFTYSEGIEMAHMNVCLNCSNIIGALYQIFLNYEDVRCNQWNDIREILNILVLEQNVVA